ncbi:MAG: FKBP-type peptidyl-prolyl cis-trans isomerase [Verrucomicrobiaceae bacterium]|nr:FKBP-type peptidyl-prolyl cis-trans isomerase [Verrucomicrobiaceae bacterium]
MSTTTTRGQTSAPPVADLWASEKESAAYLAANAIKEGVNTMASGLQYKIIKTAKGLSPKLIDRVRVHYHGTLIDGTVIDSSILRGEPVTFPVNAVIQGWTQALQLMKVGEKWQLFIPPDLAYGKNGVQGVIGPNSTLIFNVELLGIEK